MVENSSNKSKGGGAKTPNRQGLYAAASKYSLDAIETLFDLMKNAKQESVRMGAAKALLDKALPDVKAVEITGEDHGPLLIKVIEEKPVIDE